MIKGSNTPENTVPFDREAIKHPLNALLRGKSDTTGKLDAEMAKREQKPVMGIVRKDDVHHR